MNDDADGDDDDEQEDDMGESEDEEGRDDENDGRLGDWEIEDEDLQRATYELPWDEFVTQALKKCPVR